MDHQSFDITPTGPPRSESRRASIVMAFVLAIYQAWILGRIRRSRDVCIEAPTGSGKTLMIRTLVALDQGMPGGFSHVIVAAPQEQIEQAFLGASDALVSWPHGVAAQPTLRIPDRLFRAARRDGCGTRRSIQRYLAVAERAYALVCTHSALCTLREGDLPADLTGRLLICDEAHHVPARGLSRVARLWRERGGRLLFLTATPYRTDGQAVVLDGMKLIRRSTAEHMQEGYAPRRLTSEIVAIGGRSERVLAAQFTGDRAPPDCFTAATTRTVVKKWLTDGKPKTIVRVPPGRGPLVGRLVAAFGRAGARVLDASGMAKERKYTFLQALERERGRTFSTSKIDVIIGIARVCEGTDWPHCAAVYSIGIPASLQLVAQLAGRALRRKPDGYPAAYRDLARMVFFVPGANSDSLAELGIDHSRHALLVATYLADHEIGAAWIATAAVQRGVRSALTGKPEEELDEAIDVTNDTGDLVTRAEARLALAAAHEQLAEAEQPVNVETLIEQTLAERPDLPLDVVEQAVVELLASLPDAGAKVAARVEHEIATHLRIDPQVREAMRQAFGIVLSDFREQTLEGSPFLAKLRQQVHVLSGGDMRAFADRLKAAVPVPLTIGRLLSWADAEHAASGAWPSAISGDVRGAPGETWGAIDRALRMGARSLPPGGSLAQLLELHRGAPNHLAPRRVTRTMIATWARAHFKAHDRWPSRASGPIPGTPFTWCAMDVALQRGLHGLRGSITLARFLESLGARNISRLIRLSDELVAGWAHAFRARHGRWPTKKDGQIDGAPPGETWTRIGAAIVNGLRDIRRRTSLAQFLFESCGAPPPGSVRRELTLEFVTTMAVAYLQREGTWPHAATCDPELEKAGETWHRIDRALRTAGRGLPRTTLLRLHAEYQAKTGGKKTA
ncbi:MAG: DEAD/DEAH box helicase family protein [Planctomycetes bacterium]|nr:DEAD/DEAH box helicase family protein [Planctomycetota bacterium]